MSKMKLRKTCLAGCLAAVLGTAAVTAYAAQEVDVDRMCSLTVDIGEEGDFREELAQEQWDVSLYRIASVDEKGEYTAKEGFESLEKEIDGAETAADLDALAEGALTLITADGAETGADALITMTDGKGAAENLAAGLYILASDPVETEKYEYTFQPSAVYLPGTVSGTAWGYDQSVILKYERSLRYGSLRVVKTLDSYNEALGPVTFVFQIEGVDEKGETVYSNVLATTHSTAGTQSAAAEGIPAGTTVTVTEVYSGASYKLISDGTQTGVITADGELSMEFSNTYDDRLVPGYGAVNNFQYDENSGWQWSRTDGNAAVSE